MSALVRMPCGRGGRARFVHAVPRLCCEADLRSSLHKADLIDQGSVRLVIGKPPRTVEDREPTVRVFVNAHVRLDEVAAVTLLGDLQHATRVADRVVVPHHARLLDAQDVVECPHEGHEGRALLSASDREPGVVVRDVDGREPAVGGLDRGEPLLAPSWRMSGGSRLWSVPNSRSIRPRPSGQ
jgi:hypothetical protein